MASSRVIGLDIGTTAVRAVEVEFGSGGPAGTVSPTLLHAAVAPLPPGAVREGEVVDPRVVSDAIRGMWSRGGFSSKDVVIGVGNQRVVVRELELPWMPAHQLKASLPFQVQELLPVASSEALLDFHVTGESQGDAGRRVHGMLVAAQRDTVAANVLAVEGAGLRPVMVDLNGFALLRALCRGEYAEHVVAFVDIGARLTNVVVADHGTPKLVRVLPSGGQNITDAVAAALQVSQPEADQVKRALGLGFSPPPGHEAAAEAIVEATRTLVESIRNTFVYYASNHPGRAIESLVVTGGGAHLSGLGQFLSSSTRLPAGLGDPVAGFRLGKNLDRTVVQGAESTVALPVGLAYGVAA
ncbi:type IV pilus assembly protein PilM [Cellulomonas iranensis]|uniref:type IV pilus assembly protein PilM n=1 Tax=Cellulomonas iranensis TaxID=76862 RepID=UPI0013D1110E|nr:type IV pilus assembly protein PilM [Cellulomonas iranensis]